MFIELGSRNAEGDPMDEVVKEALSLEPGLFTLSRKAEHDSSDEMESVESSSSLAGRRGASNRERREADGGSP